MNRYALSIVVLSSFLMSGCMSHAVAVKDADPAPKERVLAYQSPSDATLVVVRDSSITGAGCYAGIYLNGKISARLGSGEKATFYVPAGDWVVGAGLEGDGLCKLNLERNETESKLLKGDKKAFRVYTSNGGDISVMPSTIW